MDDHEFTSWFAEELATLPNVVAVALGGSRAQGTHRPESDWDFAIYYEGSFDPDALREMRWEGEVSDIGGWGGGVMNGGAWLNVDGRRADVHYRDLGDVLFWCGEAVAGRFQKELLLFYVAGIPTYTVMGELAVNLVISGELPRFEYPDALAQSAGNRWLADARASLGHARAALAQRGDVLAAIANGSRGVIEASHSRLAQNSTWALNEKGIADAAGIAGLADALLAATTSEALGVALEHVADVIDAER